MNRYVRVVLVVITVAFVMLMARLAMHSTESQFSRQAVASATSDMLCQAQRTDTKSEALGCVSLVLGLHGNTVSVLAGTYSRYGGKAGAFSSFDSTCSVLVNRGTPTSGFPVISKSSKDSRSATLMRIGAEQCPSTPQPLGGTATLNAREFRTSSASRHKKDVSVALNGLSIGSESVTASNASSPIPRGPEYRRVSVNPQGWELTYKRGELKNGEIWVIAMDIVPTK